MPVFGGRSRRPECSGPTHLTSRSRSSRPPLGGLVALGLVAALTSPGPLLASGSHGTAAWDDGASLRSDGGLVLGRHKRGGRKPGPLLRYDGPGHVLTVAPTRAGKGVGAVVPNLLDHPGPSW